MSQRLNRDVWVAFVSGLLFVSGLAISGMTNPDKIRAFLAIGTPVWRSDLAIVMGGAVAIYGLAYHYLVMRRRLVASDQAFSPPKPMSVDSKLVVGAALFGIGWGLSGLCPAPAVARLSLLDSKTVVFVGAMVVGFRLSQVKRG